MTMTYPGKLSADLQQEEGDGADIEVETCTARLTRQEVAVDEQLGLQAAKGIGPLSLDVDEHKDLMRIGVPRPFRRYMCPAASPKMHW